MHHKHVYLNNFFLQFVERRDTTGAVSLEQQGETGLGFCLDFSPSKTVGTAAEWLLVGSQDVAYDLPKLKELGVTHILNVGVNIPNAFPSVSCYTMYMQLTSLIPRVSSAPHARFHRPTVHS